MQNRPSCQESKMISRGLLPTRKSINLCGVIEQRMADNATLPSISDSFAVCRPMLRNCGRCRPRNCGRANLFYCRGQCLLRAHNSNCCSHCNDTRKATYSTILPLFLLFTYQQQRQNQDEVDQHSLFTHFCFLPPREFRYDGRRVRNVARKQDGTCSP